MSDWLKIDRFRINRPVKQTLNGVELEVLVSPYDVPEAVRAGFNEQTQKFVIQFRYASPADSHLDGQELQRHVTLRVGRQSRRLFEIELDSRALNAEKVGLTIAAPQIIGQAIDSLTNSQRTPWRRGNYRLAREVINDRKDELFGPIVTH